MHQLDRMASRQWWTRQRERPVRDEDAPDSAASPPPTGSASCSSSWRTSRWERTSSWRWRAARRAFLLARRCGRPTTPTISSNYRRWWRTSCWRGCGISPRASTSSTRRTGPSWPHTRWPKCTVPCCRSRRRRTTAGCRSILQWWRSHLRWNGIIPWRSSTPSQSSLLWVIHPLTDLASI